MKSKKVFIDSLGRLVVRGFDKKFCVLISVFGMALKNKTVMFLGNEIDRWQI